MAQQGAIDVAARVRAARGWRGLEVKELAAQMGYSTRTWARVEDGEKPLDYDERQQVATICGVPPVFMEKGFKALAAAELERRLAEIADDLAALRRDEEEPPEEPDPQ
jgi:transcriptional regulator with XRE-family HTH domain